MDFPGITSAVDASFGKRQKRSPHSPHNCRDPDGQISHSTGAASGCPRNAIPDNGLGQFDGIAIGGAPDSRNATSKQRILHYSPCATRCARRLCLSCSSNGPCVIRMPIIRQGVLWVHCDAGVSPFLQDQSSTLSAPSFLTLIYSPDRLLLKATFPPILCIMTHCDALHLPFIAVQTVVCSP